MEIRYCTPVLISKIIIHSLMQKQIHLSIGKEIYKGSHKNKLCVRPISFPRKNLTMSMRANRQYYYMLICLMQQYFNQVAKCCHNAGPIMFETLHSLRGYINDCNKYFRDLKVQQNKKFQSEVKFSNSLLPGWQAKVQSQHF